MAPSLSLSLSLCNFSSLCVSSYAEFPSSWERPVAVLERKNEPICTRQYAPHKPASEATGGQLPAKLQTRGRLSVHGACKSVRIHRKHAF